IETPISGGSRESETSEETVTPIRSPSTSTLRIETPCGQSRISPRRSSPVVMAENATERVREGGGGEIRTHGARRLRGFQDLPVRPLRHPAAASSVAAVATMKDLDKLALGMPEAAKEVEDERPVYKVHGKMFCFHRSRRPDALDPDTGERLDDVLVFRVDDLAVKELLLADDRGTFFTTPHWDGYAAVLVRIRDLGLLDRDELRDLVVDAWLTRAQKRVAKA